MAIIEKQVLIVVPVLNAEKTIGRCLQSLRDLDLVDQTLQLTCRIVVVNNNSTDRTSEILSQLKVHTIFCRTRNRSLARNTGFVSSSEEFVAFVDADVELSKGWLLAMMHSILESGKFGCGESNTFSASLGPQNLVEDLRQFLKVDQNNLLNVFGRNFPMVNSAACIFRRQALNDVAGFDEKLNSFEDIDLSKRLLMAGWVLFCEESANAWCYSDRATVIGFCKRYFEMGKGQFLYKRRWSGHSKLVIALTECYAAAYETFKFLKKLKKFSTGLKRMSLLTLMSLLIGVKLLGSLSMLFSRQDLTKFDMSLYRPVLKYRGVEWSVVSYKFFFLLFNPVTREFKKLKKTANFDIFSSFIERNAYEN